MRLFSVTAILASLFICVCCTTEQQQQPLPEDTEISEALAAVLRGETEVNPFDNKGVTPPDEGCVRLRVRGIGGTFGKVFNDSNYQHIEYAVKGGIKPIENSNMAWQAGKNLVKIESTANIYIDSLAHSYPYLRPHAAALLEEIGLRFRDSLDAHGGGAYRPKVTSVLRSPMTVGMLRHVNRNATQESAHRYATTFDISHSKFICDDSTATRRTFEDLKNLLALIIYDLRREGRCLVKHERKQACFHITAIQTDSITHM